MNNPKDISNKTILISALDWGFGHTTRCVALIHQLIKQNNQIIFAGNKLQTLFMIKEFPSITVKQIKGYNVTLSSQQSTYLQIAKQFKKIKIAIKKEHQWVEDYVNKNKVDIIISDNRYGFRSSNVTSIFMGHQLNVYVPYFRQLVNKKLSQYINQFNYCWIVDDESINLAGELSNPKYLSINYQYIGLLNRFTKREEEILYEYLIIISGAYPENERFLKEVEDYFSQKTALLVIISTIESKQPIKNAKYIYQPTTKELNRLINQSKIIVSKMGYTTLMEMVSINKPCILIPTKGQYEQEYLGKTIGLKKVKILPSVKQIN